MLVDHIYYLDYERLLYYVTFTMCNILRKNF